MHSSPDRERCGLLMISMEFVAQAVRLAAYLRFTEGRSLGLWDPRKDQRGRLRTRARAS